MMKLALVLCVGLLLTRPESLFAFGNKAKLTGPPEVRDVTQPRTDVVADELSTRPVLTAIKPYYVLKNVVPSALSGDAPFKLYLDYKTGHPEGSPDSSDIGDARCAQVGGNDTGCSILSRFFKYELAQVRTGTYVDPNDPNCQITEIRGLARITTGGTSLSLSSTRALPCKASESPVLLEMEIPQYTRAEGVKAMLNAFYQPCHTAINYGSSEPGYNSHFASKFDLQINGTTVKKNGVAKEYKSGQADAPTLGNNAVEVFCKVNKI